MRIFDQMSIGKKTIARRRGFTFVELLVVIAIIIGLIGMLLGWAVSARHNQKIRATEAVMNNLLLAVDTVKRASPIFPDHRLANYFYIQPHTAAAGVQPTWAGGANNRRMSSGEFFIFLASLGSSSNTMVNSLGSDYLPNSPVPASWGVAQGNASVLVDVFEQDPRNANALDKDKNSPMFSLVSPSGGYPLRAPVDAWGTGLLYRLSTDRGSLNQTDSDTAPMVSGGTYRVRERILQDEQLTRDRYAAMGMNPVATIEYIRPAVPAYSFPCFMSAGPDGIWGSPVADPSKTDVAGGFKDLIPPNVAPNYTRDPQADPESSRDAQAKDNIYSQWSGR